MNFWNVGSVQRVDGGFRARVRWNANGLLKTCPGPRRPDEDAAKADLQSMRAAASGMGREDGFAAMDAEAKRLIAGKAPKAEGSIKRSRRSEERRAEEDLEIMREASSRHEDVLASRKAVDAEVRRLQQLADTERRVEILGDRLAREQAQQQRPSLGQRQRQPQQQPQRMSAAQQHPIEDDSDSQSDGWEPGEADDADTVYPWERFDDRGRPLPEPQQQADASLPPIPEPRSADEASLLLAQFRPFKRTPEELKRLLEARADPNIVIPTEAFGGICPLKKIPMARNEHVPIFFYARASFPITS